MRKTFLALCLCALLLMTAALSGCARDDEMVTITAGSDGAPATPAPAITPQPRMNPSQSADENGEAPAASPEGLAEIKSEGNSAQVSVVSTAAYVFDLKGEKQLYGAVEYKNTGDCTVILDRTSLSFSWPGGKEDPDFAPPLAEHDPIAPGGTGYLVYYAPWKGETLPEGGVTLSATLAAKKSAQTRADMAVGELYLARNYPGFCTLSGTLTLKSAGECDMNMVYVGFYGASGEFLGAWNFTRNALFASGESKRFSVQMTSLPIQDLETRAVEFRADAFGF